MQFSRITLGGLLGIGLALFPGALNAVTATPFVEAWGFDDNNASFLNPFLARYVLTCPWLDPALPNSATADNVGWDFSDPAKWRFRFGTNVPGPNTVGAGPLQSFVYSAWVVNNDPYNLPTGAQATPVNATGDVGGANFTLLYVPGANDPGGANSATTLANVHFFQFIRTITTFQDEPRGAPNTVTRYFVDNNGSRTTPFYDLVFSSGLSGPNNVNKWIDDTPFRCENQDNAINTQHDVILFGGRWWGFTYTNADVPESSPLTLAGIGLCLIAIRRSLAYRRG
jgi:hypothetical protein